jgi:hypothetical protein
VVLNLLLGGNGRGGCPAYGTKLEDDSCLTGVDDSGLTVFLGMVGQKGSSFTGVVGFLPVDDRVFMFWNPVEILGLENLECDCHCL